MFWQLGAVCCKVLFFFDWLILRCWLASEGITQVATGSIGTVMWIIVTHMD